MAGLTALLQAELSSEQYTENFSDLHPPLSTHEAFVESDRCYFCYDAPCVTACPTGIDIPLFIRQILADNPSGAGKTIFDENILGGMCARACPTRNAVRAGLRAQHRRGPAGQDRRTAAFCHRSQDGSR